LYAGIAGRGIERLIEHKDVKEETIPGGTKFQYIQVKTKAKAHELEKKIIKKEKPQFNTQDK